MLRTGSSTLSNNNHLHALTTIDIYLYTVYYILVSHCCIARLVRKEICGKYHETHCGVQGTHWCIPGLLDPLTFPQPQEAHRYILHQRMPTETYWITGNLFRPQCNMPQSILDIIRQHRHWSGSKLAYLVITIMQNFK